MCLLTGFAFYIVVRCGFDKYLYLTSCRNAHDHNTCIRLPQTDCTARKMALFVFNQDCQTQVQAGDAMATTIITVSTCNNPSDSITEIVRLEQFNYYNQKQNEVLYVNVEIMDVLPPTAPSLLFARETCMPYWLSK